MTIHTDNYEIFFINYFDGVLTEAEIDALMQFLREHPELEDEFHACRPVAIPELGTSVFSGKDLLKKRTSDKATISPLNIDEFFTAYIEKDLTPEAEARLMLFIESNPQYNKDFELYKKTILVADKSITFENKKSLKKAVTPVYNIRRFYYTIAAAAAVILFMVNIFLTEMNPNTREGLRLADKGYVLEARAYNPLFDNETGSENIAVDTFKSPQPKRQRASLLNPDNTYPESVAQIHYSKIPVSQSSPVFIDGKRDEYSSIYDYVKIAESQQGAEDYEDVLPKKQRDSFLMYAYNKLFNNNSPADTGTGNNTIWQLVDVGTYGINTLAKTDVIGVNRSNENNTRKTDFALGGRVVYSNKKTADD